MKAFAGRWEYLIGGLLKVLSGSLLASILSLVATVLVSRHLGASDFGILAILVAYAFICEQLFSCQTWQGVIKFGAAQENEVVVNIVFLAIGLDILIALAAMIAANAGFMVSRYLVEIPDDLVPYIQLYLLTIALRWYGPSLGFLRLKGHYHAVSIQPVAVSVVRLLAALSSGHFQLGLTDLIVLWAVADVVGNIAVLIVATHYLRLEWAGFSLIKFLRFVEWGYIKAFLGFSLVANLHSSLKLALKDFDVILLGLFAGAGGAGVYKVAKQVPQAINMLMSPIYQVVFPEFAKLSKTNNFPAIKDMIVKSVKVMLLVCIVFFLALCMFGREILGFIFGPEYESGYVGMVVYSIGIFVAAITITFQPAMLALDAASAALRRLAFSVLIYGAVLLGLMTIMGQIGAAIAFVVFYCLWAYLIGRYVFDHLRGAPNE